MAIDFGGIAKGYAADRAAEILKDNGIESATISLGGNVYVLGNKNGVPWKVAIQNPFDTNGDYYGIISAEDCSIITSGDYQRYFEKDGIKYHHIIDPSTLKPADSGLVSVTIVTENGAIGDGLSTALFVMGLDAACSYWRNHSSEFDFVIIDSAGNTYVSSGLENSFSSDMEFELIY